MLKAATLLFAAMLLIRPAAALDCPTPYLCFLNGNWSADGTSFGKPSRVTMRWEAALDGKFARVDYRIVTKTDDGKDQVFDGVGFYRPREGGTYDGTWFDSQGAMHPLKAMFTGATLDNLLGREGQDLRPHRLHPRRPL